MQTLGYLLIGTLVFSGLITIACVITLGNPVVQNPSPKLKRLGIAGLGSLFLQFCLGALLRDTHNGLACPNFPNCLDQFFPIPFTFWTAIAFFHRWLGVLMLGLFLHLAVEAARTTPSLARPTRQAFALSVAQVFLGIGNVMGGLSSESRIIHAGVGYALWGILFYVTIRSGGCLKYIEAIRQFKWN